MPNYIIGEITGVTEGDTFLNRQELRDAGIHLAPVAGIDGNPKVGASSIVLNGGYVDDNDLGDEIIYTGHGGNDSNTKKQIADQNWDATGNKALIVSEMHGLPIRVTRGFKHKSAYSPKSGYEFGGLYMVTDHFEEKGKNGFVICRFRLEKTAPLLEKQKAKKSLSIGSDHSLRVPTTTLRIVRDTKLAKEVKELYDYSCQICGIQIAVRGVKYAEAAHIKPLGKPHNGEDKPGNIICLCPNHHVMFDKGIFTIDKSDYSLIGLPGKLNMDKIHTLEQENIEYHKDHIFINDLE